MCKAQAVIVNYLIIYMIKVLKIQTTVPEQQGQKYQTCCRHQESWTVEMDHSW